jgi:hypothetical protein
MPVGTGPCRPGSGRLGGVSGVRLDPCRRLLEAGSSAAEQALGGVTVSPASGRKAVAGGRRSGCRSLSIPALRSTLRAAFAQHQSTAGYRKSHIRGGQSLPAGRRPPGGRRTRDRLSGERRWSRLSVARSGRRRRPPVRLGAAVAGGNCSPSMVGGRARCGKLLTGASIDYSTSVIRPVGLKSFTRRSDGGGVERLTA